ncbi:hypothetical protein [Thioclava sp.]|uniref:hypothetical protein n=1 Tax=Thioclava sp. TaxID=1933450 RepID=UPI003AA8DAE1
MSDKKLDRETIERHEDGMVEALLAQARAQVSEPQPAFLARVMEDALEVQAGFAAPASTSLSPKRARGASIMQALRSVFGGWGAMGGLVTAGLAGLWIGFIGSEQMGTLTSSYWQSSENLGTVNLLPVGETLAFVDEGGF